MTRAPYGTGSLYQRASDGRWVAAISRGWTSTGTRRRVIVTGAGCQGGCAARCPHRAAIKRKLRERKRELDTGGRQTSSRLTVKAWSETYLARRVTELSPKGYNAAANPIGNWIIPTIGHRRLDQLGPDDVRDVHAACRKAGRSVGDVHRALHTMLQVALQDGHHISQSVLAVKPPRPGVSDRMGMSVDEGLACLEVAGTLPHGLRWVFTLLYGARLGECLGMTWDAIDLDAQEARIEWQLQSLPYRDRRDKSLGFRVPDGHESRHLVDGFHLVRPKSKSGWRVAPLLPFAVRELERWREIAPENPWGLVWPNAAGRPANDKHDRAEWHALQETAGVHHPTRLREDPATGEMVPAFYHVHETRNFAATMLLDADVPEHVVADLLGHSTVAVSLRYRTRRREPLRDAMTRVGERLQLT